MTITARYAATCSTCRRPIAPGAKIEWSKGQPVRHTSCSAAAMAPATARTSRSRGTWTGCRCGSVEEYERDSDCRSCRHDR